MTSTMKITGVCGRGSLSNLSKNHLWTLLSLDELNESLHTDTSDFTKANIDFNFSGAPRNSEPSTFLLMLYNPGTDPVDWAFLFPADQQLKLAFWAISGHLSDTELYQMKVQDNHLFSVKPRSGKLMGGEQRAVTFTYRHDFAEIDQLPVVLKVSNGREITLNLQGTTVEADGPFLSFASEAHVFSSVAIGDRAPPKQMYSFYNQGAVPVHFEVGKAALLQVQEENCNHPVLRCLNPVGDILPGEAATLEWIFSPLEAKLYQTDVPIFTLNGESTIVRFKGRGLRSNVQPLSDHTDVKRVPFQKTFLSEDSIDFGNILVSSKSSKMLLLVNNSQRDTVLFEWELNEQLDIAPSRGTLCPGGKAPLFVTLSASDYPTVFQSHLVCRVNSEAALAQYHAAAQQFEEEKERLQHEFIITDKAPKDNKVVLTEKEAASVALRQQTFWKKYKTLPPIRVTNDFNTVRSISTTISQAEQRAMREIERAKAQREPKPPKPCLLHLWVTAQSHGPLGFLTQSPERLSRQYGTEAKQLQVIPTEENAQGLIKDFSSHACKPLLEDTLKDALLVDKLAILTSKPVFYRPLGPSVSAASSDKGKEPQKVADDVGEMNTVADLAEEVCRCVLQDLAVEAMAGDVDPTEK